MTAHLEFTRHAHPSPASEQALAAVLEAPGFGVHFTDHMVSIDWDTDRGWHDAVVTPYAPFPMDPAAMVLHYGQAIFEGLKVYRQPDGSLASFRPGANADRLQSSAARMAMPALPAELFRRSIEELLAVDHRWVPVAGGEDALYLRPFMFATEAGRTPGRTSRAASSRSVCGCPRSTSARLPAARVRRSSPATTPRRCSHRPRPRTRGAIRWCGSTRSSGTTSRRWAG